MAQVLKLLQRVNIKSIIFNFKYFPFKTAIKLPVLISRNIFLHKMQGRVIINAPIKTALIQIGYGKIGISDFKRSRGIWEVYGDVVFNGRAFIMHGCKLNVGKDAQLIFGDQFEMSTECAIVAQKKIEIGNHSGISWESLVMDSDFHHIADENGVVFNHPKEIIIGNNVWVGCRCTILKGAVIPDGSIVAAGSLVTKKLSGEKSIFGGNPIKVLKSNVSWWY
ncbi:acyltransferase [Mucilaginibacter sp. FT3.2]|uniref:acyltransferase n=1 Tax=Mucilaginibacter sp. FT3.2 TaxID=2723090 RepID=UPI0016072D5B|nr:acyltransferase [Mucilaginibacter sp. FT3.2]MBB6232531.1 acetyltransferase-like isoleucine patch superfamily enzyme [Mucilaginibacter sp. FT3.2]